MNIFKRNGEPVYYQIEFPSMWANSCMMNRKNRFFEMVEDTGSMKKLGLLLAKWNGKMEWK